MFEYRDCTEWTRVDNQNLADIEIPEPMDHWSLEDFSDIVPVERH